jgi:hypothetical protein
LSRSQSRRLGWAQVMRPGLSTPQMVRTFAALVPLECDRCRQPIHVGDWFTRGRAGIRICWICRPFHDLPPAGAEEEDGGRNG